MFKRMVVFDMLSSHDNILLGSMVGSARRPLGGTSGFYAGSNSFGGLMSGWKKFSQMATKTLPFAASFDPIKGIAVIRRWSGSLHKGMSSAVPEKVMLKAGAEFAKDLHGKMLANTKSLLKVHHKEMMDGHLDVADKFHKTNIKNMKKYVDELGDKLGDSAGNVLKDSGKQLNESLEQSTNKWKDSLNNMFKSNAPSWLSFFGIQDIKTNVESTMQNSMKDAGEALQKIASSSGMSIMDPKSKKLYHEFFLTTQMLNKEANVRDRFGRLSQIYDVNETSKGYLAATDRNIKNDQARRKFAMEYTRYSKVFGKDADADFIENISYTNKYGDKFLDQLRNMGAYYAKLDKNGADTFQKTYQDWSGTFKSMNISTEQRLGVLNQLNQVTTALARSNFSGAKSDEFLELIKESFLGGPSGDSLKNMASLVTMSGRYGMVNSKDLYGLYQSGNISKIVEMVMTSVPGIKEQNTPQGAIKRQLAEQIFGVNSELYAEMGKAQGSYMSNFTEVQTQSNKDLANSLKGVLDSYNKNVVTNRLNTIQNSPVAEKLGWLKILSDYDFGDIATGLMGLGMLTSGFKKGGIFEGVGKVFGSGNRFSSEAEKAAKLAWKERGGLRGSLKNKGSEYKTAYKLLREDGSGVLKSLFKAKGLVKLPTNATIYERIANLFSTLGKGFRLGLRGLGKLLGPVGAILGIGEVAYDLYQGKTKKAIKDAGGTIGGAFGATIGFALGGPIGAAIGGLGGYMLGTFMGDKYADALQGPIIRTIGKIQNKFKELNDWLIDNGLKSGVNREVEKGKKIMAKGHSAIVDTNTGKVVDITQTASILNSSLTGKQLYWTQEEKGIWSKLKSKFEDFVSDTGGGRGGSVSRARGTTPKVSSALGTTMFGGKLTQEYLNFHPKDRTYHHGLDYGMPTGTRILSTVSGIAYRGYEGGGYGKYVYVVDGSGNTHVFAHLYDNSLIKDGQPVSRGDLLGKSGNTGKSTGPHLHYEVRSANGVTVDPVAWIGGMDSSSGTDGVNMASNGVYSTVNSIMKEHGIPDWAWFPIMYGESRGNVNCATDPAKTSERSYGLFQINMTGQMGKDRLRTYASSYGLRSVEDLFNPSINAQIAADMMQGVYKTAVSRSGSTATLRNKQDIASYTWEYGLSPAWTADHDKNIRDYVKQYLSTGSINGTSSGSLGDFSDSSGSVMEYTNNPMLLAYYKGLFSGNSISRGSNNFSQGSLYGTTYGNGFTSNPLTRLVQLYRGIKQARLQWQAANQLNDSIGMNAAHNLAEDARVQMGALGVDSSLFRGSDSTFNSDLQTAINSLTTSSLASSYNSSTGNLANKFYGLWETIKSAREQWTNAKVINDLTAMDAAHAKAEDARADMRSIGVDSSLFDGDEASFNANLQYILNTLSNNGLKSDYSDMIVSNQRINDLKAKVLAGTSTKEEKDEVVSTLVWMTQQLSGKLDNLKQNVDANSVLISDLRLRSRASLGLTKF